MNTKILFNDGWEFAKGSLSEQSADGLKFKPVELPHDWLIYDTQALYENSIGWYRKEFYCESTDRQLLICFDGVYMDSTLYVNSKSVGEWKYGYTSHEHDITSAMKPGLNHILLKVVHQSPNSRWYSGAGIYRNVWLKTRSKNYIESNGIYVSTKKVNNYWNVNVSTDVHVSENCIITHTITKNGKIMATSESGLLKARGQVKNTQQMSLNNPLLWSPSEPHLYTISTQLYVLSDEHSSDSPVLIESITQNIGFRYFELNPKLGLFLNGERIKLNGVCEHHDLGALGAAFNKSALQRRFKLLKEMGVNAIRTAHNPPSSEFMDLADEIGFLIVSEAFDMWERPKTQYDYARFFNDGAYVDVKSWITRDRNHPSIFLWSIGNEIYDTHLGEKGEELTRMLAGYVKEFDPDENAKTTIASNYMPWSGAQKCADIVKVAGYNYGEKYYQKHREEHPDWIIYGSETSAVVQSRGIYHFPFEKPILADDDEQCSSLGNSPTSWGAKSTEACILAERDTPFSLGQFIWSGFDYIGEPTPYHTKNSYFGQLDTATFKKDSFYIYQSAWTDYRKTPFIHIFPYWDFNPGQMIDVRVCSNAPKIELYLNDRQVGAKSIDHVHGKDLVGWWKIPYEKGELKAVALNENNEIIAADIKKSFGDAKKLNIKADKYNLSANGADLSFVEITAADESGNPVENATNRILVKVTGEGRLIGLDNGDSTDLDQYKGVSKRLFSGKLMAIVASTNKAGEILIEASSKGLAGCTAILISYPADKEEMPVASTISQNEDFPCILGNPDEIPLRKIEISTDSDRLLDKNQRETVVRAKLYPENTSYAEIEWSAVNNAGVETNTAKVEALGSYAKITAIGDGEFYVRAAGKNGSSKIRLISQLEFKATGIGPAYKDPYAFISASLYDYSKGEVGNGNEKGVATARDGVTLVGFRDIDFGKHGSDLIILPIFALTSEEYAFKIYEGMPDEVGSGLLAECIYQKPTKWNVYQCEQYRLAKKLRGVSSICFAFDKKVHIKGFSFERQNRAFEQNNASFCDQIYGDSFKLSETAVTEIGNNVTLEFDDLDFGEKGAQHVKICGNSPIDRNTLHLIFSSKDGDIRQIAEFTQTCGYEEKLFSLKKIAGKQKLSFVFLPGSNFDFKWFQFYP